MAEGGGDFGFHDPELDHAIDNGEQEVDTTRPFQPGAASTPYQEQYEMQTMQHEQSGLPDTSYEETPFLRRSGSITDAELERRFKALREDTMTGIIDTTKMMDTSINPLSEEDRAIQIERVKKLIKASYPNANVNNLVIAFSRKRPLDIVILGPRGGETKVVLDNGSGLQSKFLNLTFVKKELGTPAKQIISQTSANIIKRQKELKKERANFQISQQNLRSKNDEIQNLDERLNEEQAKIDQLKEPRVRL